MPSIAAKDEIEIGVEPDIAFRVVSDYENISSWLPIYKCEVLDGSVVREGAKVLHQYGTPPFVMSRFTRMINRIVPNERLEETYIDGDLKGHGIWEFQKSKNGTVVSFACNVTSQTWFPHITFSIFGKNAHSNVYKPLLKKLKAHCESL